MPSFKIVTRSVFENVYLVTAETLADAQLAVLNECDPPDFHQKHLGESIIESSENTLPYEDARKELLSKGYF